MLFRSAPAAAPKADPPKPEEGGLGLAGWLVIAVVIVAILFFVMRGKKSS